MTDLDEQLEKFANMDLNDNGIADKVELKTYLKKGLTWLNTHKVTITLVILLSLSLFALYQAPAMQTGIIKQVEKQVEPVNMFCFDLNHMKISKTKLRELKDKEGNTTGERFIVWRNITEGTPSYFLTIKEPIEELKYNKAEFSEHLKREAENAKEPSEEIK